MKFTGTKENISRGINIAAHLATRATNLPILSNILLETKGGALELSSTNLEVGVKTRVRGKVEVGGSFAVRAKVILDYINLLPGGNVVLGVTKGQLQVSCENFKTAFKGQISDEFPIIPVVGGVEPLQIPLTEFKRALEGVLFATSLDETRPEISGILMWQYNEKLTLVATDSYRLAEKGLEFKGGSGERRAILPLKALQEVSRIAGLSGGIEEAAVYFGENQTMFVLGPTTVTSRTIEGTYPDYEQIIPIKTKTEVRVDREGLAQAVRAAAPFTKAGVNDVHIQVDPSSGSLKVESSNAQVGSQEVVLPVEGTGEPVAASFNYRYLLDGLTNMNGAQVTLGLDSGATPALLTNPQDETYHYLIMPIKQ